MNLKISERAAQRRRFLCFCFMLAGCASSVSWGQSERPRPTPSAPPNDAFGKAQEELNKFKVPADETIAGYYDRLMRIQTDPLNANSAKLWRDSWRAGDVTGVQFNDSVTKQLSTAEKSQILNKLVPVRTARWKRAKEFYRELARELQDLKAAEKFTEAAAYQQKLDLFEKVYARPPLYVAFHKGAVLVGKYFPPGGPDAVTMTSMYEKPLKGEATLRVLDVNGSVYDCELKVTSQLNGGQPQFSQVKLAYDFDGFVDSIKVVQNSNSRLFFSAGISDRSLKWLAVLCVETMGDLGLTLGYSSVYAGNYEFQLKPE